eukprot:scaffold27019_cov119-Skeletonema_dohrnii-CCMP3373.AAC.1
MSEDNIEAEPLYCAYCGVAEIDELKLKECAACDLVRYCSDACQKNHKSQHVEACKKRAAELRDELLFKQPESSHLGDCPICFLPLPLDKQKSNMMTCCSKVICLGCYYANHKRQFEGKLERKCPFCRKPAPSTMDEVDKQTMKRIEANDPIAMYQEGIGCYNKGDYSSAFEHLTKAAKLGDVEAHFELAGMYHYGQGVEKDEEKSIHHAELAAIGGHPTVRCNLAYHEERNGDMKRAERHLIIAATQGKWKGRQEVLAAALRAHQAAVEETKSPQREAADEYNRKLDSMRSP